MMQAQGRKSKDYSDLIITVSIQSYFLLFLTIIWKKKKITWYIIEIMAAYIITSQVLQVPQHATELGNRRFLTSEADQVSTEISCFVGKLFWTCSGGEKRGAFLKCYL